MLCLMVLGSYINILYHHHHAFSNIFNKTFRTCNMNHSSLFFRCNNPNNGSTTARTKTKYFPKRWYYSKLLRLMNFTLDDIDAKLHDGELYLKPSARLLKKLNYELYGQTKKSHLKKKSVSEETPKFLYTLKQDYADLGKAYAVADLNGDGNEDVVVGCPGYVDVNTNQRTGAIFILYGTDEGLKNSTSDISSIADAKIIGPVSQDATENSKFGSSIAIFDLDADGQLEIAVGAPSFGSVNLTYYGRVNVYTPVNQKNYTLRGTIDCQDVYCTLGTNIISEDINDDSLKDLLISSPYAPAGGAQRGIVVALLADKQYLGKTSLKLSAKNYLLGTQNYSWFGYSLAAKKYSDINATLFVVGAPGTRKCEKADCSFDPADVQAIGQINVYYLTSNLIISGPVLTGQQQFQMLGSQMAIGRLLDSTTGTLVIAASGQDVKGRSAHDLLDIDQAGAVYIYKLTDLKNPITVLSGDRKFGRFGATIKVLDINSDGIDDLIVGAPLRTEDVTEEITGAQQGRVYVYLGGASFSLSNTTSDCAFTNMDTCLGLKADRELSFNEDMARFGSRLSVVKCKTKTQLLVTAEHSAKGGRLAGAIGVFDL